MKKNRGLIRATAASSVVAMTLVAAPALARPAQRPVWPKKATVSLGQQAVSGGAYSIPASWSKTTYTTEFRVALKDAANNSLDSETVPSTTVSWTAHTTARPGTQVHVVVTPYNGTRAGASKSSATISLKDMTPPQGTYTAKTNVYTATLTQQSLSDDAGAAGVTRTVEWGDGSSDPWGTGSTMTHTYAAQGSYRAVVHLKDAAGNTTDVPVDIVVKDSTAPSGTYSASWSDWTGTISQDVAPSDDFDGANVSATVDWADGSPTEAWTPGAATMSHDYQSKGQGRYIATVTLADSSGNSRVYQLPVLIHDDLAPVATYTVSTATRTVWARYTKVKLTQADSAGASSVDNMSPDSAVKRVVRWGDKTSTAGFAATTSLTHVYAAAGTYHPVVTLTDESGHVTKVDVDAVVVRADTAAPRVALKLPARPRNQVRKWRTLRGTASDRGVGVRMVRLQVLEKRGSYYYAYKPATGRWVKAGTRVGAAWKKAGVARLHPTARHTWAKRVAGLRRGVLTYRVDGIDRMGHTSRWLVHSQRLTR